VLLALNASLLVLMAGVVIAMLLVEDRPDWRLFAFLATSSVANPVGLGAWFTVLRHSRKARPLSLVC
jgi:hypothetical protein